MFFFSTLLLMAGSIDVPFFALISAIIVDEIIVNK